MSLMDAPAALESSNLTHQTLPRPLLVGSFLSHLILVTLFANSHTAKFTGYQYGGRPLGITFVKYLNAGPGPEIMDGAEPTGGITQDQIM